MEFKWADQVARIEISSKIFKNLIGKCMGKRIFERHTNILGNNIKMDINEQGVIVMN